MSEPQPIPLVDRLTSCSIRWARDNESTRARLAKLVVNDGAFFERMGERGPTTATLEKFARFMAHPDNWPGAMVPIEVQGFAHAVGVSAPAGAASRGNPGEDTPSERAA